MTTLEVILLVSLFVMVFMLFLTTLFLGGAFFVTYKVVKTNFEHQNNIAAYKNYIAAIAETVTNHTDFLKSNLVEKMGSVDDPEYKQLQRGFDEFKNIIMAIYQSSMQLSQEEGAVEE